MLLGDQPAGSLSLRSQRSDDGGVAFGSSDCKNGDGLLLSRSSLNLQVADQSPRDQSSLQELYDIGRDTLLKSGGSSAFGFAWPGEPATPNGTGDAFSSQSPVCVVRTAPGHGCGPSISHAQPLDPLAEDAPSCFTTPRRRYSCSHGFVNSPTASSDAGRLASLPLPHQARFLSFSNPARSPAPAERIAAWPSPAAVATPCIIGHPAFSGTANASPNGQSQSAADARAQCLELHLREQRALNEALARQLRERDAEVAALRCELRRMRAAQNWGAQERVQQQGDAAAAPAPEDAQEGKPGHAGLLSQLQRAREKLCVQQQQQQQQRALEEAARGGGGAAELPAPPCTPPPAHVHASCETQDRADGEEASADDGAAAGSVAAQQEQGPPPPLEPLTTVLSGDDTAPRAASAAGAGDPAVLAAERARTDRAHAALLSSSRQAARLASQVAALRAHAAELRQELADWRSACLDNHRQLARLKREAAAAGAGAGAAK